MAACRYAAVSIPINVTHACGTGKCVFNSDILEITVRWAAPCRSLYDAVFVFITAAHSDAHIVRCLLQVTFVIYLGALLAFVGWFLFAIYVGIGFVGLPIDLFKYALPAQ
jgi:hypothetical protein